VILVAGGTGRLGSLVVDRLVTEGRRVRVLTRDPARSSARAPHGLEVVVGDVRDPAIVRGAVDGVDTVVSAIQGFAGPGHVSPKAIDRDANLRLIAEAEAGGAAFVLMSIVDASPTHAMELARMKHAAETRLRAGTTPWTIVRSAAFLETWEEILETTAGRSGRPLVFGRGENPINFVSVVDVAEVVANAAVDPSLRGRTIDVHGPRDFTMNQLAAEVQAHAGRTGLPRHLPRPMLRLMAVAMRPLRAQLARQARAALAMDRADFTRNGSAAGEPAEPRAPLR